MSTAAKTITAEQLAAMPDDGGRHELVRGQLKMMSPAGAQHGRVAMRIGSMLEQHVRANQLGEVFAAETGFLLASNPDTVRAPNAAFLSTARFEGLEDVRGFLPVAPDLAIEVVSPRDSSSDVEAKPAVGFSLARDWCWSSIPPCVRSGRIERKRRSTCISLVTRWTRPMSWRAGVSMLAKFAKR